MRRIAGVQIRRLTRHEDARGSLAELLRGDWPEFAGFGQALLTRNLPGVVRAWHWHHRQTDAIVVIEGRATVPLYDPREGSPTRGEVNEFTLDGDDLHLVVVPPLVYHGYVTVSAAPALILNFPSEPYDPAAPDEERVPHDTPDVPYRWPAPIKG